MPFREKFPTRVNLLLGLLIFAGCWLAEVDSALAQASRISYYYTWNNEVFNGKYTDTLLCDGTVHQYMVVKCEKHPQISLPSRVVEQDTILIQYGSISACSKIGIWTAFQSFTSRFCGECRGDLGWEKTDYSNPDSILVSNPTTVKLFDRNMNLTGGLWGSDYRSTFSCIDRRCAIYDADLRLLVITSPELIGMKMDSLYFEMPIRE